MTRVRRLFNFVRLHRRFYWRFENEIVLGAWVTDIYMKTPVLIFEYTRCLDLVAAKFSKTGPRFRAPIFLDVATANDMRAA